MFNYCHLTKKIKYLVSDNRISMRGDMQKIRQILITIIKIQKSQTKHAF